MTTRARKTAKPAAEVAPVSEVMQDELEAADYPADCPTFRAFKSLSRRERATVMGKLKGIDQSLFERDENTDMFVAIAGIYEAAAAAEEFLREVAIDVDAYDLWVQDVEDLTLVKCLFTYVSKEKLGEQIGSSSS